jgi:hypothetical protein
MSSAGQIGTVSVRARLESATVWKTMQTLLEIVAVWFGLNLAIPAFILWQRLPLFRQRVFRLTLDVFGPKRTKIARDLLHRL